MGCRSCRSRTLYPSWATDARVWKPTMQDGIQLFNFSRQTVVRLLLSRNWAHDKTACLHAFWHWSENVSQLSEFPDTQRQTALWSRFSSVVHKVENYIKSPRSLFKSDFAGFCMRGGQIAVSSRCFHLINWQTPVFSRQFTWADRIHEHGDIGVVDPRRYLPDYRVR